MDDIAPSVWPEKGACSLVAVAENAVYAPVDGSRAMRDDTVGVEYLKKAIESCQSRGIDVLLTYIPFAAAEEWQLEANRVPEIAAEYGVDYIDFLDLGVIDYDVDCSDAGSHINPSGARKVTEYLGRYIMDRYDIPDRRGDPDYANWYDDYKTYTQFKIDVLVGQTDVKRYLMLLQDKHLSSILYLAPSELWHGDSIYEKLLANMGIESEKLNTDRPTLAVVDNKAGTVSYLAPGEETDASFGRLAFVQGEGAYQAVLDGAVQLEMTDQTMGAAVVNNATDSIVTTSMFTASTATSFTKVA